MTEILIGNFNWDEPEEIIEASGGKTYFAKLRLYLNLQVQRFKAGESFTLPGVWEYHFNESDNTSTPTGNLLPFKGMTLGPSKTHLHLVVAELLSKDQVPYQRVWRFNNWKDKDGDKIRPNAWEQYQFDEFKSLPQAKRDALAKTGEIASKNPDDPKSWVFAKYDLTETGYTGQYEIKNYLANVIVFDNEQEWKKAEQEWRSQFNSNSRPDYSHYPQMWQSKPEALAKYVQKLNGEGKSYKEIAIGAKLMSDSGDPVDNANGDKVDVTTLLAELLDLPEELVTL